MLWWHRDRCPRMGRRWTSCWRRRKRRSPRRREQGREKGFALRAEKQTTCQGEEARSMGFLRDHKRSRGGAPSTATLRATARRYAPARDPLRTRCKVTPFLPNVASNAPEATWMLRGNETLEVASSPTRPGIERPDAERGGLATVLPCSLTSLPLPTPARFTESLCAVSVRSRSSGTLATMPMPGLQSRAVELPRL
jgi:hypothetical protein